MNVGERIKFFRQSKNLTVNKLANMAGISQSYLRDIELGNKQPTVEYLSYVCDALGITLEHFFADEKSNDELLNLISNLSPAKRESLIEFLKTISDN